MSAMERLPERLLLAENGHVIPEPLSYYETVPQNVDTLLPLHPRRKQTSRDDHRAAGPFA